jgi:hypothetical protein
MAQQLLHEHIYGFISQNQKGGFEQVYSAFCLNYWNLPLNAKWFNYRGIK